MNTNSVSQLSSIFHKMFNLKILLILSFVFFSAIDKVEAYNGKTDGESRHGDAALENDPSSETQLVSRQEKLSQPMVFDELAFSSVELKEVTFKPLEFKPIEFKEVTFKPIEFKEVTFKPIEF